MPETFHTNIHGDPCLSCVVDANGAKSQVPPEVWMRIPKETRIKGKVSWDTIFDAYEAQGNYESGRQALLDGFDVQAVNQHMMVTMCASRLGRDPHNAPAWEGKDAKADVGIKIMWGRKAAAAAAAKFGMTDVQTESQNTNPWWWYPMH